MKFKLALCQMAGTDNKEKNKVVAGEFCHKAADQGAQIIVLPEMWNCPYSNEYFRPFSEPEDGETAQFLGNLAKDLSCYLVGGSFPEIDAEGNVYNTSLSFDPKGQVIAKHRKAHLFDIDIDGGIRFMESETLTAGNKVTVMDTEFGKVGVAICYDVRFPELFRAMALEGAKLVILPAAFNMTTGPVHWQLTMRARALDNQLYLAACAPARVDNGIYLSYGHSMVADPWGQVMAETGPREDIVVATIDTEYVDSVRRQLPLLAHRREELYR